MRSVSFSRPELFLNATAPYAEQTIAVLPPGQMLEHWLPESRCISYSALTCGAPPAPGLMPPADQLARALADQGIDPSLPSLIWDLGGSGMAARLAFALCALAPDGGTLTLLDGGLPAWLHAGLPTQDEPQAAEAAQIELPQYGHALATADELAARLGTGEFTLLDTRSPAEYSGHDVRAARGGHLPGAVNLNWVMLMDANGQLLPEDELRAALGAAGITEPDREIVAYCQTHHRSAHTWAVLKHLGFDQARGYAGAWGEWASRTDLPIESA